MQCVAMCCNVLQCVAVHIGWQRPIERLSISVLQCVAVCCSGCSVLQCASVCQCVAECCSAYRVAKTHTTSYDTFPLEMLHSPKSAKSRNSDSSVSRGTNSN